MKKLNIVHFKRTFIWSQASCPYCDSKLTSSSDKLLQHNYETHLKHKCKKYKEKKK